MPRLMHVCSVCGKEFRKLHGLHVHITRTPKCKAALAGQQPAAPVRVVSRRLRGGARAVETQPRAVAKAAAADTDCILNAFGIAVAHVRDIEARQESLMSGLASFFDSVHALRLAYIRNTDRLRKLTADLGQPRAAVGRGRRNAAAADLRAPAKSVKSDLSYLSDPPDTSDDDAPPPLPTSDAPEPTALGTTIRS